MKISKQKHVLIVDDDEDMREMIKDTILNHFHEETEKLSIVEAPEGASALKQVNDQKFDLVITDLVMPKFDGRKLLNSFKELPPVQRPNSILVISGLLDPSKNTTAENVTFMAKPWDEIQIKEYLESVLCDQAEIVKPNKSSSHEVVLFIASFLTGTIETIEGFCKIKAEKESRFIKKEGDASGDYSLIYFVDGNIIQSSIALSFEHNCFLGIASKMLGKPVTEINRECHQLAESICKNLIEYSQKSLVDFDTLKISDPLIIGGTKHTIKHLVKGSCLSFKIRTEFGFLFLEVVVQKKA